jgi:hypothetical protein
LVLTKRPALALLLILLMAVSAAEVTSASDAPTWSKRYSGAYFDKAYSAIQSNDGGFVVAGFAGSRVDDYTPWEHIDKWDRLHVAKFDAYGRLLWNRFYSEDSDNRAYSIIQTSDGGYAIAGEKHSPITKLGSNGYDFWLIKTDSFGNMQWEKTYDEQGANNGAHSIIQTDDGGYALAGYIDSESRSLRNILVVKVDDAGNLQWSKKFDEGTLAHSIVQTEDNGYAICGEKTNYNLETHQAFLVRTDPLGNKLWSKIYGKENDAYLYSMIEAPDQGFVLVGEQDSDDLLFLKVDANGTTQWNTPFSTVEHSSNVAYSIVMTNDEGYALAGYNALAWRDSNFWLVKTDASGNMLWNRTYCEESGNTERAYSLVQTSDGGYFLAGVTDSPTESIRSHFEDFLLVKTDASGFAPEISETIHFSVAKEPELSILTIGAAAFLIGVVIIMGLLIYFKKRKH